jgi:hypothetical protein
LRRSTTTVHRRWGAVVVQICLSQQNHRWLCTKNSPLENIWSHKIRKSFWSHIGSNEIVDSFDEHDCTWNFFE